ncbi:MAG: hypothetical protein H8K07_18680 [Nitrospira sp.]|nr:hypothetical protein [Nitrospira sp.]MDI3463260.1 hypothetical protein [Nitrospira sp.]
MTLRRRMLKTLCRSLFTITAVTSLFGCNNYLVFTTSTKFGIDASQNGNQPPHVVLGYKRAEVAIIPAEHKAATETEDTYAVLGDFCVMANPSLYDWIDTVFKAPKKWPSNDVKDSLQIRSIFATGMAARAAADNDAIQAHFARATLRHTRTGASEKNCF